MLGCSGFLAKIRIPTDEIRTVATMMTIIRSA